ncbi:hypothetical protein [Desulfitobacterium chlororespirans]|uniref:Uncharacterized protein n=1 Tax=Desulfitobacterium chlororespirans DSM 11544 TaxID=1121395 RepID=A0A1M7UPA8_9FIRM|nr:hypothetical protein [Desulfitobacterium chlororespirans]SHN84790.1 hypothetical protein SAMN02745215_04280 [Desulfitobacterium chlororespirans DSM 11544]
MAELTTGLIENTAVFGVRPTVTLVVRITNDGTTTESVTTEGSFVLGAAKVLYVLESINLLPGEAVEKIYFADFDAFEFQFSTSSPKVVISAWGKDEVGNLVAAHRVLPAELDNTTLPAASNFADFFALMPPDNAATVAPGTDVSFPQDGPTSGTTITRTSDTEFNLSAIGTYQVLFQVSVSEAGQLVLTLDGDDLAYTAVGRATGTSQIVGMAYVTTTVTDSVLTVRNPADNATALTITPIAGGTVPVSAQLVITQIA